MQSLYLLLEQCDRVRLLMVYRPPWCPTCSLLGLANLISKMGLDLSVLNEVGEGKLAQDFLAATTISGLSQVITGPTHIKSHVLLWSQWSASRRYSYSVFVMNRSLSSELWIERGSASIRKICPRTRMDPDRLLNALGDFPGSIAGDSDGVLLASGGTKGPKHNCSQTFDSLQ